MSSPTSDKLAAWRVFLETSYALIDILERPAGAIQGDLVRLVQDARDAQGNGGRLALQLDRLLAALRAKEESER